MIDYEILKIIWWLLVGILLLGFAFMDGHDMGAVSLLPIVGKIDEERRVVINTVGPHWDGNQVWFISAGGALFAAWPLVYATAFSGLYFAMMAVLWSLFFRPLGFDYRSKLADSRWRNTWDWLLVLGSAVPALLFGVALGNVLQGIPFQYDASTMRVTYLGSFWGLLNPFALLAGLVSIVMIVAHGANFLALRSRGEVRARARKASVIAMLTMMIAFAGAGIWVAFLPGYVISSGIANAGAVLTPLDKTVAVNTGGLLTNFLDFPLLWLIPALAFMGGLASILFIRRDCPGRAFIFSGIAEFGVIFTAGTALFPFVLPSSAHADSSLTLWDCVSSQFTLNVMFWVALIMTPLVIAYTGWAYRVMRGPVTVEQIQANNHSAY